MENPTENFDLNTIKAMCAIDAKAYLRKYFVPLNDGNHAFFENGKFTIKDAKTIKSTYFNRISKELNEFYFKDYLDIRSVTFELNKPTFFENYLNMCPTIKAKNSLKFTEHSERSKQGVQSLLSFIKEVLSDGNEQSYQYLVKWFANMLQGNKNDACLYLKGQQGIGKSTITEFLQEHVIGQDLLLITGSEPLRNHFNLILGGKLLVVFEELENFSASEWASVSSVLKRYVTGTTYLLQGKGQNAFQTNNMNNYIINSNNDAIKDDDGRRYFILDISHKYKNNHQYFGSLRKQCFDDEVGQAFYSYMIEYNISGFIPQLFPTTESKLNSYAKRLDKVYCFLKEKFILQNQNMNITAKEIYDLYTSYCKTEDIKKDDNKTFHAKLKQVGLEYRKTKGNHYYIYTHEALLAIANENKWIHELDEFANEETPYNSEGSEIKMLKELLKQKDLEIEQLKAQLAKKDLIEQLF